MLLQRQNVTALLGLAAAALALVLIALPGLHGPLVLDSVKLLSLDDLVRQHGQEAVLHTPPFGRDFGRILSMASFVLNAQLAGELSAFQLKLTNLVIHLACGVLVFSLTRLLAGTTLQAAEARLLATATALLWLLSPLNFNVTLYAIQRMTQLSALFTFAGLLLYTAGRLHPRAGARRIRLALCVLVCLPLAVLSKQNGALLVVLAFLVEGFFLHAARPWLTGRQLALIAVAGGGVAVGLLLYLYPGVLDYHARDFTLAERLLSQPRALMSYLQHLVLPYGADAGIYTDDFAASRGLLEPLTTLPALLGVAAMIAFCIAYRRFRLAIPAFGIAFFLGGHLLESTFVALELYFVHRNYLPGYGIYLALAWMLMIALPSRRWTMIILSLALVYFGAIDYARSLTWSDRERIAAAAVRYHPDSPRALSNLAQVALDHGNAELALALNRRAIALTGALNHRLQRLFIVCRSGAPIPPEEYAALRDIDRLGVSNELGQALGNLLGVYQYGGCDQLDIAALVASLDHLSERYAGGRARSWTIDYHADAFLYAAGQGARTHRRLRERLAAGHLESGLYHLELLIREGRTSEAADTLERITRRFDDEQLREYRQTLSRFETQIKAAE